MAKVETILHNKNKGSLWLERTWVLLLRVAPLHVYTYLIRVLSRIPLPRILRQPILGKLAEKMDIDLAEARLLVDEYRCFRDIFIRRLKHGVRPIVGTEDTVIFPVDGCLMSHGPIDQKGLIQAKGIYYPLTDLVDDVQLAQELDGGTFCTLYLRPKDYHRIHLPLAGQISDVRHIKGTLFPVKPYMVRHLPGLFARNERMVFKLSTKLGTVAMVCVAAAGVGNITITVDQSRRNMPLERGEEIAAFNLGSTVILIFPPGCIDFKPIDFGQEVRVGQALARWRHFNGNHVD